MLSDQNSNPHSAASTEIVESSNPTWSPVRGPVDGSVPVNERFFRKRRKRKNKIRRMPDSIQKDADEIMDQKSFKTPRKSKKAVKKQLTFSTGPELADNP